MKTSQQLFSEWVESYSDSLFRWALYKTSDREQAEDLVQETFIAAWENHSTFKGESSAKTWLQSILNRKIIDVYRKKSGKVFSSIDENDKFFEHFFNEEGHWEDAGSPREWKEDDTHLLDRTEFREVLEGCFKKLPANWKSSLNLKYLEEKKGEDICQELGITPSNFWQMLHRAKLQLRECLEINWFSN